MQGQAVNLLACCPHCCSLAGLEELMLNRGPHPLDRKAQAWCLTLLVHGHARTSDYLWAARESMLSLLAG